MAAEEGNLQALNNLGIIFINEGKNEDALKSWKKAAFMVTGKEVVDAAQADAQDNLGNYFLTRGDFDQAKNYFRMAADNGNVKAQFNMGVFLFQEDDIAGAELYWTKAAKQGDEQAIEYLSGLAHK